MWSVKRYPIPDINRENILSWVGSGVCTAINGILLVYASLPKRTPEELQPILLSTQFLWTIPACKLLVAEKAKFRFCQWTSLISIMLIVWGVVISLIPTIIAIIQSPRPLFTTNGGVAWTIIFMISVAPAAIANVFFEQFFKRRRYDSTSNHNLAFDTFWVTCVSYFINWLIFFFFFWIDFIPNFGSSANFEQFWINFKTTSHCAFSMQMCPDNWWLGQIFILSFFLQSVLSALMSAESANFVNFVQTLSTPLSSLFFVIFPVYNTGPQQPLYTLLPAMALLVLGVLGFKFWERSEEKRIKNVQVSVQALE